MDTFQAVKEALTTLYFLCTSRGYLHGLSRGLLTQVPALAMMVVWLLVVAVIGQLTVGHRHQGFSDIWTGMRTLFTPRKLSIGYLRNTEGFFIFVAVLFLTMYLVVPIWLGISLAYLQVSWEGRRGRIIRRTPR